MNKENKNLNISLERYNLQINEYLNNSNRWNEKIVYTVSNSLSEEFVAITFGRDIHLHKFIQTVDFLQDTGHLIPSIVNVFHDENTALCQDMGGVPLNEYLILNPAHSKEAIQNVINLLTKLNLLKEKEAPFRIPLIVKKGIKLSESFPKHINFIPHTARIVPELFKSKIEFKYGCGILDPHILNFRILENNTGKLNAFFTDFDDWSEYVNYYWSLGYLFSTVRWIKKEAFYLASNVEQLIISYIRSVDIKSEFMFYLGVLSSYLGYRNIILASVAGKPAKECEKQKIIITALDKTIGFLGNKILQ